MRKRYNYLKTKQIPIGRKRYYETLRKPRYIWLHKKLLKLSDWLYDLAYNIRKFNKEYNEVEYQKMRYRTIYKTEYIEEDNDY